MDLSAGNDIGVLGLTSMDLGLGRRGRSFASMEPGATTGTKISGPASTDPVSGAKVSSMTLMDLGPRTKDLTPTSIYPGRRASEPGTGTRFLGTALVNPRPVVPVLMPGSRGTRLETPVPLLCSLITHAQVTRAFIVYVYLGKSRVSLRNDGKIFHIIFKVLDKYPKKKMTS